MSSKLWFSDVENSEVGTDKLAFGASLPNAVSVTTGTIVGAAVPGGLVVDATNGVIYRAWNNTSNYEVLNSSSTSYGTHQYSLTVNAAVTSTDGTAPIIGDFVGIFGAGAWASAANINISRNNHVGLGSQNATLISTGQNPGGATLSSTELYNGATWSLSIVNNSSNSLSAQPPWFLKMRV